MKNDLFGHFKRQTSFENKSRVHPKIYFQIDFDEYGAFLSVVDKKSNALQALCKFFQYRIV